MMSKKPILFMKAHIGTFTRTDGTVVQAHDTSVAAASPYQAKPNNWGGHSVHRGGTFVRSFNTKDEAHGFAGALNATHHAGKSDHMAGAVREAASKRLGLDTLQERGNDSHDFVDTGKVGLHHALVHAFNAGHGGKGNDADASKAAEHIAKTHGHFDTLKEAHSDREDFTQSSRAGLEAALQHAYGAGVQHSVAKPARKKPAAPGAGPAAPAEGDGGHEEHKAYGKYFRKGEKVRDQYGKTHTVMEHRGPQVHTYTGGGEWFHPTKLWHA